MAQRGRRPVLDESKQREIAALMSVGCSQRVAARYVGCAPSTITYTIARNPRFADKVRQAKCSAEVGLIRNIRNAAKKEQYWRAAAWMLERGYPDRYAPRGPDTISKEQIAGLLAAFSRIVAQEVPVSAHRKNALRRLEQLSTSLTGRSIAEKPQPEGEDPADD